jgi:hypothetical protein
MKSGRLARRLPVIAGGAAIATMVALTAACGGGEKPSPSSTTTTTTTTSSVAPSPTEKNISPTGGNSFSPTVLAPGAPTARPGNERNTGPAGG